MSGRHLALPLEEEIVPLELRACPEPGPGERNEDHGSAAI